MVHVNRRESLFRLGTSLGSLAFTSLLCDEVKSEEKTNPLAPRDGHFPTQAKNCIFLMMEGGPSHIDTFDPKPVELSTAGVGIRAILISG